MAAPVLQRFESRRRRTAGVDADITMLTVGANARITTQTAQEKVIGFALTHSGADGPRGPRTPCSE